MREIKFRAWDEVCKCMINPESKRHFKIYINGSVSLEESWCTQDIILMQFTGLKDKNGKEIYEGDVVAWQFADGPIACTVEWQQYHARFSLIPLDADYGMSHEFHEKTRLEIIGNIYENPELLGWDNVTTKKEV